ncbi:MAG: glycosyltransferase involved in cell wall biosynthesis [Halioglobus sp.]|jgi:glycosyltransferase involved in cell wall biosynthesis
MTTTVSVIIPVYNSARYICRALDSVLAQNMPGLQIIVVDDGSTDNSATLVSQYAASVTLLRQGNRGPAAARNWGVEQSRGEFLMFLDADDLWPEGRLQWQLEYLQAHPEVDVVQGTLQLLHADESGQTPPAEPHHANSLCTAFMRREAFLRVGLLDETLRYCEDLDWFFAAQSMDVSVHRSDRLALIHRRHDDNATNRIDLVRHCTLQVVARHRLRRGEQTG